MRILKPVSSFLATLAGDKHSARSIEMQCVDSMPC